MPINPLPNPMGIDNPLETTKRIISHRRLRLAWWLAVTAGLGLLQIWTLLCVIFTLSLMPEVQAKLVNSNLGISRVLGNSVLLFFATTLLGQSVYTLWSRGVLIGYHLYFAGVFLVGTLVPAIIVYVVTVLLGEPATGGLYTFQIALSAVVVLYAGFVELLTD